MTAKTLSAIGTTYGRIGQPLSSSSRYSTKKYIDHVQLTVAEEEGVGTHTGYYEHASTLRGTV